MMGISEKEKRQGYFFCGEYDRPYNDNRVVVKIFLLIEEKKYEVGELILGFKKPHNGFGNNTTILDRAWQRWVKFGFYTNATKDQIVAIDPELLKVLELSQIERLEGVEWYRLTWRFLLSEGSSERDPIFILTKDKSNLPSKYKRILEIGEDAYKKEEQDKQEEEKRKNEEEKLCKERIWQENRNFIMRLLYDAFYNKHVDSDDVKRLMEFGLLEPTTDFRGGTQFPGECWFFCYDFFENDERLFGYIGFDKDLALISIDKRLPFEEEVYLLGRKST